MANTTFLQMQEEVERQCRMDLDNSDQLKAIKYWINEGHDLLMGLTQWWFLEQVYTITLSNLRLFPFPTTNEAEVASILTSIDVQSMRTRKKVLTWVHPNDIDRDSEDWTTTSERGTPTHWTTEGENIALNKKPNENFISGQVALHFRGYQAFTELSADGDFSDIPQGWRYVPILHAISKGWDRQGDEQQSRRYAAEFDMESEKMVGRCRSIRGPQRRAKAPTIWTVPSRRSGRATSTRRR